MKRLIRLVILVLIAVLAFRLCTGLASNMGTGGGSIIIPNGGNSTESSSNDGGGWLNRRSSGNAGNEEFGNTGKSISDISRELEEQLGIGQSAKANRKVSKNSTDLDVTTPSTTSSAGHLAFRGVPINGSLSNFMSKLASVGYTKTGSNTLSGKFAGYDNCTLTVYGDNPVQRVSVAFPVISNWNKLEAAYDALKDMLTEKYGEPQTSTNSNVATFTTNEGQVILDADVRDQSTWHVILDYVDSANNSLGSITNTTGSGRSAIDDL